MHYKINKSEEEWRKLLSAERFHVARQKGTEPPFSGEYYYHSEEGTYHCVCCGEVLFDSEAKYDSGSGWPSFFKPHSPHALQEHIDHSFGMIRTEISCSSCGGHLGHVFDDGIKPTGLRYCVNSLSLSFQKRKVQNH